MSTRPYPVPAPRSCVQCGGPNWRPEARYVCCGLDCSRARDLERNRARKRGANNRGMTPCRYCGTPFKPMNIDSSHCSQACRWGAVRDAEVDRAAYEASITAAPERARLAHHVVKERPKTVTKRTRAIELHNEGRTRAQIAEVLGVGETSVRNYLWGVADLARSLDAPKSCDTCKHGKAQPASDTGWECLRLVARACNPLGVAPKFYEVKA